MKNVGKLTEGAILLAAFAAILLITVYVPLIGSGLNFVLPLPFMMFAAKNTIRNILAFTIAAAILSFLASSFIGLGFMLLYGVIGSVIGYLLQKNMSRTAILISSSLVFMAGVVAMYAVNAAFFKIDIIQEFMQSYKESAKMSEELLRSMGQESQIEQLNKQNELLIKTLQILAPSLLIWGSIICVFVIQWICFPIIKRFGIKVQPWGSFRNLSLPKSLLWYYLIAMAIKLFGHPAEGTYLYIAVFNAIYLLEMFMVLQGLSFVFYIFHKRSVAKGLGVLVAILAFIIPTIHYIIMLLGIIDLGFNFRKRLEQKE
ncbi:YybS family protein [Neobacillus kokaensis]|uniref:Membrane protein n=1 Tax=Neobacillus kokaensis TaxID=2759023 RepID=A0ABQ3N3K0_9BACI|nr:YybS family protein [Neobacillus kokaensis]GHH98103.1 membrane protein [Neobacillus kokaensis]